MSTIGGVQYRGGYHDKCGGYLEYCGGYHEYRGGTLSTVGDIMMHVEDIMSTVEGNLLLFEYPTVLNTPTVLMISLHMYHDIPHGTQISKDGIPHGTHDIPHVHHDIPHGTEHPPRY